MFVSLSSSLFGPVSHCLGGWFKKNLNVYDVINCLIKNLMTHFAWYLEKEIRCDIETLSIDKVLNTEHFHDKLCRECVPKASPRPLFNYQKALKKLTLFFLLNPVPFNGQSYQKQKGSGTSHQLLFRPQNKFRKIPLFVIYYLIKF